MFIAKHCKNLSRPLYGNTVVTAVTLVIGENRYKIAYFSHGARCAALGMSVECAVTAPENLGVWALGTTQLHAPCLLLPWWYLLRAGVCILIAVKLAPLREFKIHLSRPKHSTQRLWPCTCVVPS